MSSCSKNTESIGKYKRMNDARFQPGLRDKVTKAIVHLHLQLVVSVRTYYEIEMMLALSSEECETMLVLSSDARQCAVVT